MVKKSSLKSNPIKRDIERLLKEQTAVILSAVDAKIEKVDGKIAIVDDRIMALDDRIGKFEMRFNKKLDQLMTTLDRFLKRLTDSEDEFVILKKDVNQIKAVLKEKLGVNLF
jgi:hypothetical protein